jgi:LysR family transcriptional regulator, glycine cleavage system transcriptional activator
MRPPRLNALRTFETVGRHLSFSMAAEELHITQAAVSQQIRQLETDLGKALFHRHHRQIALTDTAQVYLPVIQQALGLIDKATEQHFGAEQIQTVTIHCTSSLATQWLAPHVSEFRATHPDIVLHIRTLENMRSKAGPDHDSIEIFCASQNNGEAGVIPLFDSVITPVAAPGHLADLLHRPAEILGRDLIHVVGYDDDWHRWFATFGLGGRAVPNGLSVDSSLFAIDAALRGDGIHLGRRPFIDNHLQSGTLVEVFDLPLTLKTTYFLRTQKKLQNARAVGDVTVWIESLASQFRNGGPRE